MTHSGRILRHRDQGTLIRPCRALRALRLNSNVDSVLSREWRFNDYKSNYKDWEAELTAAVGLSVWVGSLDPDLGPQVPGGRRVSHRAVAAGLRRSPPPGGAWSGVRSCLICEPISGVDTSKLSSNCFGNREEGSGYRGLA